MENMRGYFTLDKLPLGFRFQPTDEELINHYLKGKINGVTFDVDVIPEIDVCKCEPEDLPGKSYIKTADPEWFFFSRRDPISVKRSRRATKTGYWKPTGEDRKIKSKTSGMKLIGMKKTLVFHRGRAPGAKGTSWTIHEYRVTEDGVDGMAYGQAAFVLCRLFKKHDKTNRRSNRNDKEQSDFFPITDNSSPDQTQHAGDAVEQIQMPLNRGNRASDVQEDQHPLHWTVEDELVDSEIWPFDEADHGMTCRPVLEESQQILVDKPPEALGTSHLDTSVDDYISPDDFLVYYQDGETQQGGLFEDAVTGKDDLQEWLATLSDNPEEDSIIDQTNQKNWFAEAGINYGSEASVNMFRVIHDPYESGRPSGWINSLVRNDPCQADLGMSSEDSQNSFRMRPAQGQKPAPFIGFLQEPVNRTVTKGDGIEYSFRNMAPPQNDNAGPYVSSVHDGFRNIKEPSSQRSSDNSQAGPTGSGIVRPQKLHSVVNSHKLASQGEARRRIRLQVKIHGGLVSGKANESVLNTKGNEINPTISKPRRNFQDTVTKGKGVVGPICLNKLGNFRHQVRAFSTSKLHRHTGGHTGGAAHHLADEFARKVSLLNAESSRETTHANKICKPNKAAGQTGQRQSEANQASLLEIKREDQSQGESVRKVWMPRVGNESEKTWETGKQKVDRGPLLIRLDQGLVKAHQRVGMKLNTILEKHKGHRHCFRKVKIKKEW
ncbi:uncharacterized protein LOC131232262 [Magnolia sinica]|uniref:uncharacterized protein LOC131232262 n=1 Tax=Magnolia sinica TaxID=86752 RepID=UPI002658FA31|nr:uncharacterized protein LOC131232262 [Magnolia sinica]